MSASDTPRTDAAIKQYDGSWFALGGPAGDLLVLCRELERERDEWKAKAEANERDARYASSAANDVLSERERQINVEGWDESHDDEHDDESLALAAVCYAFPPNDLQINDELGIPVYWPDSWAYAHWKPKDRRRDLVRAAALIIAEIERLDRAAFSAEKKKE